VDWVTHNFFPTIQKRKTIRSIARRDDGDDLMFFDCGNNKINNIYISNAYMGLGTWCMAIIYTRVLITFNAYI